MERFKRTGGDNPSFGRRPVDMQMGRFQIASIGVILPANQPLMTGIVEPGLRLDSLQDDLIIGRAVNVPTVPALKREFVAVPKEEIVPQPDRLLVRRLKDDDLVTLKWATRYLDVFGNKLEELAEVRLEFSDSLSSVSWWQPP